MILRKKNQPVKLDEIFNKTKSFSTISAISLIGIGLVSVAAATLVTIGYPSIARSFNTPESEPIKTNLTLVTSAPKALALVSVKPDIKPGESTLQRERREQAEAEARAKAEATKQRVIASNVKRDVVTRERRVYVDPSDLGAVYAAAGDRFGVDPILLRAIHYVETGGSGSTTRSNPSGATGPMQFLPSTFNRHGVDGNGDGVRDVHNVEDAIFSAAAYLRACGYPDVKKALWGYNPSTAYYNKVLRVAVSFGFQQ